MPKVGNILHIYIPCKLQQLRLFFLMHISIVTPAHGHGTSELGMTWQLDIPLKFLMTSFFAAPGLLFEKVVDPVDFVSPFAWCPTPPAKKTFLVLLEHDAVGEDSSAIFTSSPMISAGSSNLNFFWICWEVEEQDEELQMAFGDEDIESMSSFSELFIFLFLEDVRLLSLLTSEAAGLASWVGGGGLGEGKPVGNMKKRNTNQIASLLILKPHACRWWTLCLLCLCDTKFQIFSPIYAQQERDNKLKTAAPLGSSLSCYCWQKKDGWLLLPLGHCRAAFASLYDGILDQ